MNAGSHAKINYYRDSNQNEIDFVVTQGDKVSLYEIKSGATYSNDWIATINRLAPQFGNVVQKAVVYGGDTSQHRTGFDLLSWRKASLI